MMQYFKKQNNSLVGAFKFKDFSEAFAFLTRVAILSEKMNHHAQIENMYNRVTLTLTTHDADNTITEKDIMFATEVENFMNNELSRRGLVQ